MLLFKFEIVVKSHEALSSVFMVNELFTHSLILLLRLNPSSTRSVSWIQSQQSSGGGESMPCTVPQSITA